jgi:hypothetical protein
MRAESPQPPQPPVSPPKGRGTTLAPQNRFETRRTEVDWEQLADDDQWLSEPRANPTEFLPDRAQSIIAENNSPDVPFRYSVNAYRGCEHGCPYCHGRPASKSLALQPPFRSEPARLWLYSFGFGPSFVSRSP